MWKRVESPLEKATFVSTSWDTPSSETDAAWENDLQNIQNISQQVLIKKDFHSEMICWINLYARLYLGFALSRLLPGPLCPILDYNWKKFFRLPCHEPLHVWAQESWGTQHNVIGKTLLGGITRDPTALPHVINKPLNSRWLAGKLITSSQILAKVTEPRGLGRCTCPVQPLRSQRIFPLQPYVQQAF